MKLLYRILRAAHANGTHHKLALDALVHLENDNKEDWQRLFLKHAALYMEGAKAPDKEFKDFRNHVLHVRDNLWGGAPAKARSWYAHLVTALKAKDWEMAVYCAGVLSHYYTDPIMPLHTAQSDAESNIHRAVEWSISKSYDRLVADALPRIDNHFIAVSDEPNWLAEMVVSGATRANQHYERLITHYNIDQGVVDPPKGLDRIAQKTIGDLLVYAGCGFALILDRAIAEAAAQPPKVHLTVRTLLAALTIPIHWITNKIADKEEAALVRAMYDELQATGTVEVNLPEDDRMIRDLYKLEVVGRTRRGKTSDRFPMSEAGKDRSRKGKRLPNSLKSKAVVAKAPSAQPNKAATAAPAAASRLEPAVKLTQKISEIDVEAAQKQPRNENEADAGNASTAIGSGASLSQSLSRLTPHQSRPDARAVSSKMVQMPTAHARSEPASSTSVPTVTTVSADRPAPRQSHEGRSGERFYLSIGDDIVDAPSIGKKTAARLHDADLYSVEDLLICDPEEVALQLAIRHITPEALIDWQDQARLVCTVPELRGTHAQILVGAGYRDPETIAGSDQTALLADILRFAQTPDGQRVLRSGQPPELDKVLSWIQQAGRAEIARAA